MNASPEGHTTDRSNDHGADPREIVVLTAPHWLTAFVIFAAVISTIPFVLGFFLGFTVASDKVFGTYAFIGGVIADMLLRWKGGLRLLLWRSPRIAFVWAWIALCVYVIVAEPFVS